MRLLLDTHTFLWWATDAPELSPAARDAVGDAYNDCWLSLVSCWEMAIKLSLGKLRLPAPVERFVPEQMAENDFRQLGLEFQHVVRVATMALHHRDPFDRLLVAQAVEEDLALVSADAAFDAYDIERLW